MRVETVNWDLKMSLPTSTHFSLLSKTRDLYITELMQIICDLAIISLSYSKIRTDSYLSKVARNIEILSMRCIFSTQFTNTLLYPTLTHSLTSLFEKD